MAQARQCGASTGTASCRGNVRRMTTSDVLSAPGRILADSRQGASLEGPRALDRLVSRKARTLALARSKLLALHQLACGVGERMANANVTFAVGQGICLV